MRDRNVLLYTTKRRDVLFAPWGKGQNDLVEDTQKYLGQVGKKICYNKYEQWGYIIQGLRVFLVQKYEIQGVPRSKTNVMSGSLCVDPASV